MISRLDRSAGDQGFQQDSLGIHAQILGQLGLSADDSLAAHEFLVGVIHRDTLKMSIPQTEYPTVTDVAYINVIVQQIHASQGGTHAYRAQAGLSGAYSGVQLLAELLQPDGNSSVRLGLVKVLLGAGRRGIGGILPEVPSAHAVKHRQKNSVISPAFQQQRGFLPFIFGWENFAIEEKIILIVSANPANTAAAGGYNAV